MVDPKNNKELMAKYFVEKNGTEFLADLMTKSFISGYDSNVEVALETVKQCLQLKDITEAVVWYNSPNKDLQGIPAKLDKSVVIDYLIKSRLAKVVAEVKIVQPEPQIIPEVTNNLFFKFVTFVKSLK